MRYYVLCYNYFTDDSLYACNTKYGLGLSPIHELASDFDLFDAKAAKEYLEKDFLDTRVISEDEFEVVKIILA